MTLRLLRFSFVLGLFLLILRPMAAIAEDTSECVACHTTGRKLVQITREIAKSQPAPLVSTESVGEG